MAWTVFSLSSHAVLVQDVGINYVGIYGNGNIFASLDKTIPVESCNTATWVMISGSHPEKDKIYSMLLAAHAAGKKDVRSSECLSSSATITSGTSDYILVK